MELLEHFLKSNFFGTVVGWIVYQLIMWRREKNKYDVLHEEFPFMQYIKETYDDWITSAFCIPLLLWVGYRIADLNPIAEDPLQWNDLFYLSAGFVPELIYKFLIKKKIIE